MIVQQIPRNDCCPPSYERHSQVQDTPSESSADSSDDYTNEEDDWDSGEGNIVLFPSRCNLVDFVDNTFVETSTTSSNDTTTENCDDLHKEIGNF